MPKLILAASLLVLAGCAATPPEWFTTHSPEYEDCPVDTVLTCTQFGSQNICECERTF